MESGRFAASDSPSQYLELEKVMEFTSYFPIKKNKPQNQKLSPLAVWRPHANRRENY